MKTFKKFSSAKKAAKGGQVLRVGALYITGIDSITSIDLIEADGQVSGTISARYLSCGNYNGIAPRRKYSASSKF